MGILPIDVATMAPKSMEVSHIHQGENVRQDMQEAKAELAYTDMVKRNQEKTISPEKSDNEEYRYDARDGSAKQQQGGKKKKKQEKKASTQEEYQSGKAVFDVKI